jgi:hypothetical protein
MSRHESHQVVQIEIVAPYQLRVTFEDEKTRLIDFSEILFGELFAPLRDMQEFKKVSIDPEVHTIVWPNGADFDPETLYNWDQYLPAMKEQLQKLAHV